MTRFSTTQKRAAFLPIACGGTGVQGALHFRALYEADGRPFPTRLVQMDTDPIPALFVDHRILIPLTAENIGTIKANPQAFGPVVETIVREHDRLLNPEDVGNGARTIRLLTQLSFSYHQDAILDQLKKCLLDLLQEGEFEVIIPVLMSSSGGGTGSALQVLLPLMLKDPPFFSMLTEGLGQHVLETPISFVVEPFAYAFQNRIMHADRVLGNAYAFRLESALLEQRHAYKYVIHIGLANTHGVVLDTPDEIARVLGTSVYQFARHWPLIKSRLVNDVDTNIFLCSYSGWDTPEKVLQDLNGKPPRDGRRPPEE